MGERSERSLRDEVKELVEGHRRALDARAAVIGNLRTTGKNLFKAYLEWRNKNHVKGQFQIATDQFFEAMNIKDPRIRTSLSTRFRTLGEKTGLLWLSVIDDETLRKAMKKLEEK